MRFLAILMLSAALAGCVTESHKPTIVRPEWVPAQGVDWAKADCKAKATVASDVMVQRWAAYDACLEAYGIVK